MIIYFYAFHLIYLLFLGEKINVSYYKTNEKNRKIIDNAIVDFIKQIIDLNIINKYKIYAPDGNSIINENKECYSKKI